MSSRAGTSRRSCSGRPTRRSCRSTLPARARSPTRSSSGASVETEDGDTFLARDAVVSTIHVKHLLEMAPPELWPEDFRYGVETFDIGVPAMGVYMGVTDPPRFLTRGQEWRTA